MTLLIALIEDDKGNITLIDVEVEE